MGCLAGVALSRHLYPMPGLPPSQLPQGEGEGARLRDLRKPCLQAGGCWVRPPGTGSWKIHQGSWGAHRGKGARASWSLLQNLLYSRSFFLSIKEADQSALPSSSLAGKGPPVQSPKPQAGRQLMGEGSSTWPCSNLCCLQGNWQRPRYCPHPAGTQPHCCRG